MFSSVLKKIQQPGPALSAPCVPGTLGRWGENRSKRDTRGEREEEGELILPCCYGKLELVAPGTWAQSSAAQPELRNLLHLESACEKEKLSVLWGLRYREKRCPLGSFNLDPLQITEMFIVSLTRAGPAHYPPWSGQLTGTGCWMNWITHHYLCSPCTIPCK